MLRRILHVFKWGLLFGLTWFVVHTVLILVDGFSDETGKNAVAVVLGNKVHPDGQVSDRLAARLDKAAELFWQGQVTEIFVSGGIGKEGQPEGTAMARYLKDRDIPERSIRIDDLGNTTWLTALNAKKIYPSDQEIVVISQYYHISRCKVALRRMGFDKVAGAHAVFAWEWRDIGSIFREFPGFYVYFLRTL